MYSYLVCILYIFTGVRGAIWFVAWGILFFALTLFYPIVELEVTVCPDPNSDKTVVYMLSVGEGGARSLDDAVATHDLQTLRSCMHTVDKPEHQIIEQLPQYVHDLSLYQFLQ